MLKLLLQKFFNRTKKKPTVNQFVWPYTVDKWISEDYPHDN